MIILQIIFAFFCGALAGGIYFYGLWQSTKSFVQNRSSGLAFIVSGIFRLVVFLGVVGFSLSMGIGFVNISMALLGFLLARIAATRWARRSAISCNDASRLKEDAHAN